MATKEERLQDLLLDMFSDWELRILLRHEPKGEQILRRLPGNGVAPLLLAEQAVQALVKLGALDDGFFDRLVKARDLRAGEINEVRRLWLVDREVIVDVGPSFLDDLPFNWMRAESQQLLPLLVNAYPTVPELRALSQNSGVNLALVNTAQPVGLVWREVVEAARTQERLRALMGQVLADDSRRAYHTGLRKLLGA